MPNETLSKEKVNLLISDSVSSPHLNSKRLAYVTQQAIAGDQVVYRMAIENNVLCQWETLTDSQRNTFCHSKKPMDSFPRVPQGQLHSEIHPFFVTKESQSVMHFLGWGSFSWPESARHFVTSTQGSSNPGMPVY